MTEENKAIRELAASYLTAFTTTERGEETIYTLKDEHRLLKAGSAGESDAEMLIAATHDNREMTPDDYRYEWTYDALREIADSFEGEDLDERGYELDPDIYTADLLRWLGSRVDRYGYVDEAVQELGHSDIGIIGDIMMGQQREIQEVYFAVLRFLEARI